MSYESEIENAFQKAIKELIYARHLYQKDSDFGQSVWQDRCFELMEEMIGILNVDCNFSKA